MDRRKFIVAVTVIATSPLTIVQQPGTLPGSYNIAAKTMGLNVEELNYLLENGFLGIDALANRVKDSRSKDHV